MNVNQSMCDNTDFVHLKKEDDVNDVLKKVTSGL